ncbi:MAG: hypothetical protein CVU56_16120 [Deltaproteobacteria bacterium HGW-Deltaproteobacteria-14]|jgi:hypothetical protein|nr:MAG: hypothetical protein CVU56_16120 [Deltaproteobacteria bacterium HGW-Deltaproteobacteria-14]
MRATTERIIKLITVAGIVPCLAFIGCTGQDGADGAAGADGTKCSVTDNGDGTTTVACDDGTTATVSNGTDGTNGTNGTNGESCAVADNGDGTMTISCDGGSTATVANGSSCTVTNDGAGTTTITCEDGTSSTVTDGEDVDPATLEALQAQLDELAKVGPESCAVCHGGSGQAHQALYDEYSDTSKLVLTIVGVTSVANGATWDATMTFDIAWNGAPYADVAGLPGLNQKTFYVVRWDGTKFVDSKSFSASTATQTTTPGRYTVTATGLTYQVENSNAIAYGYVASGPLATEPANNHVSLYADVSNAGKIYGSVTYESTVNIEGCEKCHGAPYMKHGYRGAGATNLPDFAACKTCHYDTRNGSHIDWQILVDDPARYAELHEGAATTAAEATKYAYIANIMNDTHMSHAMEFPYPQSMANCATCHEGKLDRVLTDANFNMTTCKSCHAVTGSEEYGTKARALETLWADASIAHNTTMDCATCHKAGGFAPEFKAIHSGYDKKIYADAIGTKYSAIFTATVDSATLAGNILDIKFSVTKATGAPAAVTAVAADVVPTLMVGLYGYDTKDYIVGPHERDADNNRLLEFVIGGTNPRFEQVSAANGMWEVKVDLSMWEDMITDGVVRRAEIAFMPKLTIDDMVVALNAPSRTFDLTTGAFDDMYFTDIVDVENGCNDCHDALATTFHSGDRGGSMQVCRLCHITKSGGSHLEMQSRSIDSYVHAIHSFQAFDPGDIDFTDPVEKTRYELHVEHRYPNFTIKNCQSCHTAGMFEVPDQSKSMPGLQSAADTWNVDRNIGAVPSYITGPASRACGGCHRAHAINEDNANELAAFNQHAKTNGYLIVDSTGMLDMVIETIMAMFE